MLANKNNHLKHEVAEVLFVHLWRIAQRFDPFSLLDDLKPLFRNCLISIVNQREFLCAFLDHGEIEISNNQVENAIRSIVVGRKNWLFCDTQARANVSVIVFTVLETAKANGLNPEAYLNHILTELPERFAADSKASVDDLMP